MSGSGDEGSASRVRYAVFGWMVPVVESGEALYVYQLWIGLPGRWKLIARSDLEKKGVKIWRAGVVSFARVGGSGYVRRWGCGSVMGMLVME